LVDKEITRLSLSMFLFCWVILETRYGKHAEEIARDMKLDCE
jgi:hypothetical protein